MKYIILPLIIILTIYSLVKFKKKPGNTALEWYDNSRYYRLLLVVIIGVICLIYALFH